MRISDLQTNEERCRKVKSFSKSACKHAGLLFISACMSALVIKQIENPIDEKGCECVLSDCQFAPYLGLGIMTLITGVMYGVLDTMSYFCCSRRRDALFDPSLDIRQYVTTEVTEVTTESDFQLKEDLIDTGRRYD